jgi:hypothetical protein
VKRRVLSPLNPAVTGTRAQRQGEFDPLVSETHARHHSTSALPEHAVSSHPLAREEASIRLILSEKAQIRDHADRHFKCGSLAIRRALPRRSGR